MRKLWFLFAAAGLASVIAMAAYILRRPALPKPLPPAPAPVLPGGLRAIAVFERPDGVYLQATGDETPRLLARGGSWPRWSPDGDRVAFTRDGALCTIKPDGTGEQVVTGGIRSERIALCWHPDGRSLFFTAGETVRRVSADGGAPQTVHQGPGAYKELDAGPAGRRLAATTHGVGYTVRVLDLEQETNRVIGRGCAASLSPDGRLLTRLDGRHRELSLHDSASGQVSAVLHAPEGSQFDNHFWSNHSNFIACQTEGGSSNVLVLDVGADRAIPFTTCGDASRPDLWVEPGLQTLVAP